MLEGDDQKEITEIEQCPLESRFITVTPKDVLILRQFANRDGSMKEKRFFNDLTLIDSQRIHFDLFAIIRFARSQCQE